MTTNTTIRANQTNQEQNGANNRQHKDDGRVMRIVNQECAAIAPAACAAKKAENAMAIF